MIDFIIKDFPLPPSVNKAFQPVMGKIKWRDGKPKAEGRLIKTDEHKDYEVACTLWELSHMRGVNEIRNEIILRIKNLKKSDKHLTLKVQMFSVFEEHRIFTSKGEICPMDTDNRCKLAQDKLFKILNIDDKLVFKNEIQKVVGSSNYMIIRISEYDPISEEHVKKLLGIPLVKL